MRALVLCLLLTTFATAALAQQAPAAATPPRVPTAAEALAAWQAFREDPLARLDRTGPFLDFIRDSGEVHIVLNEDLLAWMYQPMDPNLKATLYAAFLGGNMAEQLKNRQSGDGDDVAGMNSALDAYAAVKNAHPEFSLPLFESLGQARDEHRLAAAVKDIESGAARKP